MVGGVTAHLGLSPLQGKHSAGWSDGLHFFLLPPNTGEVYFSNPLTLSWPCDLTDQQKWIWWVSRLSRSFKNDLPNFASKIYILHYPFHSATNTVQTHADLVHLLQQPSNYLLAFSCVPLKSTPHTSVSDGKSNLSHRFKAFDSFLSSTWHLRAIMTCLLPIPSALSLDIPSFPLYAEQ